METGGLLFFAIIMIGIAIQQRKKNLPPFSF